MLFAARSSGLARRFQNIPATWTVCGLCVLATLLSTGYCIHYLRGAPRIIDATAYLLQAKTYALGQIGFAPPGPLGSFAGRFLLSTPDNILTVLFPPGYPLMLAAFVRAGHPLLLGPLIGGALVAVTYALARRVWQDDQRALIAAGSSALCAALRYHTADTMSHGWCALLLSGSLLCALSSKVRAQWVGGLALGWLIATRPLTGLVCSLIVGGILWTRHRAPHWPWLTSMLGVGVLFWQQLRVTGKPFVSSQYVYYAVADGPVGCFRWGIGASIGCRNEHGNFVDSYLPDGYDIWAALGTTLRRLQMHAADAGNFEGHAIVLGLGCWLAWRNSRARWLVLALLTHVCAYGGFYFDGNYPGGGARMFADVLPLEHVLLAAGASQLRIGVPTLAAAALGFAFHTASAHVHLAEREGGRPMFEESVLASALGALPPAHGGKRAPDRPLVFVNTDHGFNLGFDPGDSERFRVARRRDDANDFALWTALGRPPAFSYDFDPFTNASPRVVSFSPPPSRRFEAETLWPPMALKGGWLQQHPQGPPCTSNGDGLEVHGKVVVLSQLWLVDAGPSQLVVGITQPGQSDRSEPVPPNVVLNGQALSLEGTQRGCLSYIAPIEQYESGPLSLQLELPDGVVWDFVDVRLPSQGSAGTKQ